MRSEAPEGEAGRFDPVLSVVIPAYNEERRIGATLDRVIAWLKDNVPEAEVIVVDDGSTDQTASTVSCRTGGDIALRLLPLHRNQGKGQAVRTGIMSARGAYILMTDADLSSPIDELPLLLDPVRRGDVDVAIGSRGLPASRLGKRQPWMRERMGRIFNVFVRAVTGLHLSDTQCGFKLFSREAARRVFPLQRARGFAFDAEILFLCHRMGYRILEEPITWNNAPGSKVNPILDATRMLIDLVRIRVWQLQGRYGAFPEGRP